MKSPLSSRAWFSGLLSLAAMSMATSAHAVKEIKNPGFTLVAGGAPYTVGEVKFLLTMDGDLQVRSAKGTVLWHSGTKASASAPCGNCIVTFQNDRTLALYTPGNNSVNLSHTANASSSTVLTLSDSQPYLSVGVDGAVPLWSTQNVFSPGKVLLKPGQAAADAAMGAILSPGRTVSSGGVFVEVTPGGTVQVRKSAMLETVLWSVGPFTDRCSAALPCSLAFSRLDSLNPTVTPHKYGALELRDHAGAVVWSTATGTNAGGTLRLSGYKPYLSVSAAEPFETGKTLYPLVWGTGTTVNSVGYGVEHQVDPGVRSLSVGPGTKVAIGGSATLSVTNCGVAQIHNGSADPVWQSHAQSPWSCTDPVALVFGNGTFTIYRSQPNTSSSVVLWTALSSDNPTGKLILSATPPYVKVLNGRFERIWESSTATGLGGSSYLGTTPVAQPVPIGPNQARTVHAFLDSIGVNTHQDQLAFDPNGTQALVKLNTIGVKHIRDHAPISPSQDADESSRQQAWFQQLAAAGIQFNVADYSSDPATIVANASLAGPNVVAIEGRNEINNFKFWFNGFYCEGGWPNNCGESAVEAQTKLFQAVRANSALNNVKVYDLNEGATAMHARELGLFAGVAPTPVRADLGNVHVYPDPKKPENPQPYEFLARAMGKHYDGLTPEQGVVTEIGYRTDVVPLEAQAIMSLNAWLDGYLLGYKRTYLYRLSDANGETKDAWGMFDHTDAPKPLAWAAKRLNGLLRQNLPGSPVASPGTLNWNASLSSIGGYPLRSILLQKSSKVFDLILWIEPPVTEKIGESVVNKDFPAQSLQISFPDASQVKALDLIAATETIGINSVTVGMGAHQWAIEITLP